MHVYERSGATVMARVRGPDGAYITPGMMQTVRYTVFRGSDQQPVDGHEDVQLDLAAHVFEPLQIDARWRLDPLGYNFRHVLPDTAFTQKGEYRVEYQFIPQQGARWWSVLRIGARAIWSTT